jgi:hypothetical protein
MDVQLVCTNIGRVAEVKDILCRSTGRQVTDDGVIIEFPGDDGTARTVLEFALAERECCAHFAYEVGLGERTTLRLRASGDYLLALKSMYAR